MGSRREGRQWAMQILFETDVNPAELSDVLRVFWSNRSSNSSGRKFAEELVRGTTDHVEEIDGLIRRYAENWDIARMGRVDRNVMRIALFEMLQRNDIPPVVSINEAVDIAKQFGGPHSGKFVNGILDRARKDLDRPARRPVLEKANDEEDG